jgi:hypothetical protein
MFWKKTRFFDFDSRCSHPSGRSWFWMSDFSKNFERPFDRPFDKPSDPTGYLVVRRRGSSTSTAAATTHPEDPGFEFVV